MHYEVDVYLAIFDYKNAPHVDTVLYGPPTYCSWNPEIGLDIIP